MLCEEEEKGDVDDDGSASIAGVVGLRGKEKPPEPSEAGVPSGARFR